MTIDVQKEIAELRAYSARFSEGMKQRGFADLDPEDDEDDAVTGAPVKEFVHVGFEVKQIEDEGDFYTFEGYASTFGNVDHGYDRIEPGAFRVTITELRAAARPVPGMEGAVKLLPALWQHDMREPVGSFIELREDSRGLFVRGILPKSDTLVSGRVIPQMKAGAIADMSIGFYAIKRRWDDDIRILEEIRLVEISLVTLPMNPQAHITGFKGVLPFADLPVGDVSLAWDASAAADRVTGFADGGGDVGGAYLFESEPGNGPAERRFLIADVVKGRLTVVPRALQHAAACLVIEKARIPSGAAVRMRQNINTHYTKTGRQPLFAPGVFAPRLDDLDVLAEKEFEAFLIRAGCFSKRLAKAVTCRTAELLREGDRDATREGDLSADDLKQLGSVVAKIADALNGN